MSFDIEDLLDDEAPVPGARAARRRRTKKPKFRRLPLRSALQREGAQLALRMIDEDGLHGQFVERGRIVDSDVLRLIGLEEADHDGSLTPKGNAGCRRGAEATV